MLCLSGCISSVRLGDISDAEAEAEDIADAEVGNGAELGRGD